MIVWKVLILYFENIGILIYCFTIRSFFIIPIFLLYSVSCGLTNLWVNY